MLEWHIRTNCNYFRWDFIDLKLWKFYHRLHKFCIVHIDVLLKCTSSLVPSLEHITVPDSHLHEMWIKRKNVCTVFKLAWLSISSFFHSRIWWFRWRHSGFKELYGGGGNSSPNDSRSSHKRSRSRSRGAARSSRNRVRSPPLPARPRSRTRERDRERDRSRDRDRDRDRRPHTPQPQTQKVQYVHTVSFFYCQFVFHGV